MYIGRNIQMLRKQRKITQEELAERMGISRQTVSKWESGEMIPELAKLIELCELFSCKLDELVRERMYAEDDVFSPVEMRTVRPFRMARYVMITPNPEDDVNAYLDAWAQKSGLLAAKPDAVRIGWDFPFVSPEQQNRFGLRGYAAAYILPEGFSTRYPGVEYGEQAEAVYAVVTVTEPFMSDDTPFVRIPRAYKRIMRHLEANSFREKASRDILPCFEHVYEKDGTTYMDVYVHAESVTRTESFTSFS